MHNLLQFFMLMCIVITVTQTKNVGYYSKHPNSRVPAPTCPECRDRPVTEPAPRLADHYFNSNPNKERKKTMFLSRGWGAGGMPFSVLYMNPTRASPKSAASQTLEAIEHPPNEPVAEALHRPSGPAAPHRNKHSNQNLHQAVIPQLFVSYSWGPLGRK